jgi:hypothetical protein
VSGAKIIFMARGLREAVARTNALVVPDSICGVVVITLDGVSRVRVVGPDTDQVLLVGLEVDRTRRRANDAATAQAIAAEVLETDSVDAGEQCDATAGVY